MHYNRLYLFILILSNLVSFCNIYAQQNQLINNSNATNKSMNDQQQNINVIFTGNWGNADNEIGIKLVDINVLPYTPFNGPGGFRIYSSDKLERIIISDSINKSVKIFNINQNKVETIKILADHLGDVDFYKDYVYVVTKNPNGITAFNLKSKKIIKTYKVNFATPGRLNVVNDKLILLEDFSGKTWAVIHDTVIELKIDTLEPIADDKKIYGISIDFEPTQRKIIYSNWNNLDQINKFNNSKSGLFFVTEPRQFTILKDDSNIQFARILGINNGKPLVLYNTSKNYKTYKLATFDNLGKISIIKSDIPVLTGCWLPSYWIISKDLNSLYGFESNTKNFRILRYNLK